MPSERLRTESPKQRLIMWNFEYIFNKHDEKTAKQLYDYCSHDLPMLVAVCRGFYSNREEMTFSTGQVLRLHELRQQGRALVHDDKKNTLSVPLDYSHLFFVGNNESEALTLRQVVDKYDLPVKVKFADPHVHFDLGDGEHTRSLSKLKVIAVNDEPYFLANTIAQGMPLEEVLPIPLYLSEVTFCPVLGLKGRGITDGGKAQMDRMLHPLAVAHIDFSRNHSDREMVQLSEKPLKASDNIYHNIETNVYINVQQPRCGPPLGAYTPETSKNVDRDQERLYENVAGLGYPHHHTPETKPKRPPKPPKLKPRRAPPEVADGVYESFSDSNEPETNVYEPVHTCSVQASTKADSTTSDVRRAEQLHPVHIGGQRRSPHATPAGPTVTPELEKALHKRKKKVEGPEGGVPVENIPTKPSKRPDADDPKVAEPERMVQLKPASQKPAFPEKSNQESSPPPDTKATSASTMAATGPPQVSVKPPPETNKPTRPTKPGTLPKPRPVAKTSLADLDFPKASKPDQKPQHGAGDRSTTKNDEWTSQNPSPGVKKPAAPPQEAVPSSPASTKPVKSSTPAAATPEQSSEVSPVQPPKDASIYINQSQMAVVGPTQHTKLAKLSGQDLPSSKDPACKQSLDRQAALSAKQDRLQTETLDTMTIKDVKKLLTKLNLAKYHTQFEENQVDGLLLRDLDAVTLMNDFGMTRIETMRLRNFVEKGHLPK